MKVGTVLRVLSGLAGLAMFVVTARYVAERSIDVRPAVWLRWLVTGALVHDLVVAPAAVGVGWLVVRYAPRVLKAPLQAALLLSAVMVAVSWPVLRGYGDVPSNPTYLPRNYSAGLMLTLAVVWGTCAAWTVARLVRSRPS